MNTTTPYCHSKWRSKTLLICMLLLASAACSYRFSNLRTQNTYGVETIYVKQVFDTSKEVIPAQEVWVSMQKAFSKISPIQLTEIKKADAILTIHLYETSLNPTGTIVNNDISFSEDDPNIDSQNIPSFKEFKFLKRAGEYSDKTTINSKALVTIYKTSDKQKIFEQRYDLNEVFLSTEARGDINSEYLNFEEKVQADFKNLSDTLAERVVQDFVYRL